MAYWWETYDTTPANNTDTPPDGAPEGHFPSAVNDIARQAMAATAELGGLILAPDTGGAPPRPSATALAGGMAQLIYDLVNPVGKIVQWNSQHDGVADGKVYPVPSNVTATWQVCDGTNNTPETRSKVIGGGDPAAGVPIYTGTISPATQTGGGSDNIPQGVTGDFTLLQAHLPIVNLSLASLTLSTVDNIAQAVLHGTATQGFATQGPAGLGVASGGGVTTQAFTTTLGGSLPLGGSNIAHGHTVPEIDLSVHTHLTGLPERTAIEHWQRTA